MDPTGQPEVGNAAEFEWRDDDVFGRIASRYDLLCDVFSLGIHRLWKRRVARRIGGEPWSVLLDGATGTGDWYSGALIVPAGKRTKYVQMGYGSSSKRYQELRRAEKRRVGTELVGRG